MSKQMNNFAQTPPTPPPIKNKTVLNGALIHWWKDAETGKFIAEFLQMLESADTAEQAIERLQRCVLQKAMMFAEAAQTPPSETPQEVAEKIADELCTGAQAKLRTKTIVLKHLAALRSSGMGTPPDDLIQGAINIISFMDNCIKSGQELGDNYQVQVEKFVEKLEQAKRLPVENAVFKCPKCYQTLAELKYPSDSPLNRDQWESQLPGDLFCTCHNNHTGNKPYAYFWKSAPETCCAGKYAVNPPSRYPRLKTKHAAQITKIKVLLDSLRMDVL